jgi:hypothetical protein
MEKGKVLLADGASLMEAAEKLAPDLIIANLFLPATGERGRGIGLCPEEDGGERPRTCR